MQKDDPKQVVTSLYNRLAPSYGGVGPDFFKYCGRRMVELAEVFPRARVLDIACGRGASLFPAAEKSGEQGLVVGIDLAWEMLRETRREIRDPDSILLGLMDGDSPGFASNSFDFLLCGFAIFFFPQPDMALREWKRVLKTGGKLAICVVGSPDARWSWFNQLLLDYHERYHFPISPMSEGRELSRPSEIRSVMQETGFRQSMLLTEDYDLLYASEQQWWDSKWTHGSRFALENMPDKILDHFRRDAWNHLPPLQEPDGFHEHWQVAWVMGIK